MAVAITQSIRHCAITRSFTRAQFRTMTFGNSKLVLDSFSFRQFDDAAYGGTKIPLSKSEFMTKVLSYYDKLHEIEEEFRDHPILVDGYAPFCKHIFMPNFCDSILQGELEITPGNEHLLRSTYEARNDDELPVLTRFFRRDDVTVPKAKYLDLILYSREQCLKEAEAMNQVKNLEDAPWRIIAIKGQGVPFECPMTPITMMRNELISQGGSGVPIDKSKYLDSVKYWQKHAIVR